MKQCPCGSKKDYQHCCELYIREQSIPQTPEALMRSRYTAYSQANIEYIKKTMQGKPLTNFNENEAKHWASQVLWLELKVIHATQNKLDDQTGTVEFIATYLESDLLKTIHENSLFRRIDNRWFYIDGQLTNTLPKKISRNSVCPCGSQKKFKDCTHLLSSQGIDR